MFRAPTEHRATTYTIGAALERHPKLPLKRHEVALSCPLNLRDLQVPRVALLVDQTLEQLAVVHLRLAVGLHTSERVRPKVDAGSAANGDVAVKDLQLIAHGAWHLCHAVVDESGKPPLLP